MSTIQTPHTERSYQSINGFGMVGLGLVLLVSGVSALHNESHAVGAVLLVLAAVLGAGLYMVQPNMGAVLTLFGQYSGTDRNQGLRWANPLQAKQRISLRARNLNTAALKVNDKRGNPVEIGAAVVWIVRDSASAV